MKLKKEKNELENVVHEGTNPNVDLEGTNTRITDIEGELLRLDQEAQFFIGISSTFFEAAKQRYDEQSRLIKRKVVFNLTGKSKLALYLCAYVVLYIGN